MRVLVISEDAVTRLRAVSALRLRGDADVIEVDSALAAREALATPPSFDVLVIDGDLQPKGGFALLYSLRAQDELGDRASTPAVVLAGREQDRWLGDWAGANAVLVKPVGPFALAEQVSDLVGAAPAAHGAVESGDQVADLLASGEGRTAGLAP